MMVVCNTRREVKGRGYASLVLVLPILITIDYMKSGCKAVLNVGTQKKSKAADDDDDNHHSNFTAPQFKKRFKNVCWVAKEQYDVCCVYICDAKYHVRRLNLAFTSKEKKAEIQAWLQEKMIEFSSSMTKVELLQLVHFNKEPPIYASVLIAQCYDHYLYFTLLYHPELQPIETIWQMLKGKVAYNSSMNMMELQATILKYKDKITDKTWLGAWKKARLFEGKYSSLDKEEVCFDEDSSDNSYKNGDSDSDESIEYL